MKIKLRTEAPWKQVTLVDGTTIITKGKWKSVDANIDYKAFVKWVVTKEEKTDETK